MTSSCMQKNKHVMKEKPLLDMWWIFDNILLPSFT